MGVIQGLKRLNIDSNIYLSNKKYGKQKYRQ